MKILKTISTLLAFAVISLFALFSPEVVLSQQFNTDVEVYYNVSEKGITTVSHRVRLENVYSDIYATSYSLMLENITPLNPRAVSEGKTLPISVDGTGEKYTLKVDFEDALTGKGNARTFDIIFEEESFVERTGEVWEVSIPRLSSESTFRSYMVYLNIPNSFANEAYLSPKPLTFKQESAFRTYTFDKTSMQRTGITAGFGEFQVFSFTLNYHLENPLNKTSQTQIAIPPDTAFQKLYYQQINPTPDDVVVDEDGNWLALYSLKARERLDVTLVGVVQIFAGNRHFPKPSPQNLAENLKPDEYWQSDSPEIISLARTLKTPKAIYDFVSSHLSYDYERVRPNISRLGAKEALAKPKSAICMEFTDLFIAISRAAGIPAREINGYAYTENPEIQPLSLVADVLHSWPEYWDETKKAWIPVDPTWASTTGGVDFFNKLDLRHFAFVIHGRDSSKPFPPGSYKLGPNPQKDVFVNFGQLPEKRLTQVELKANPKKPFPFTDSQITVEVSNPGPSALYDLPVIVLFDSIEAERQYIEVLPPYANYEMKVSVPFSFLGRKTPSNVELVAGDQTLEFTTYKNQVIVYNLLFIFVIFAVVVLSVLIRARKVSFVKIAGRIRTGAVQTLRRVFKKKSADKQTQDTSAKDT